MRRLLSRTSTPLLPYSWTWIGAKFSLALGHRDMAERLPSYGRPKERISGDVVLLVRGVAFPPGAAAFAGTFGFRPIRSAEDVSLIRDAPVDPSALRLAVASFSSRHATTLPEPTVRPDGLSTGADVDRAAPVAGLSVAWFLEPSDVELRDD